MLASCLWGFPSHDPKGYGVGDVGGGDTGLGAGGGGRDYSSSPGAMAGDMEYDEE